MHFEWISKCPLEMRKKKEKNEKNEAMKENETKRDGEGIEEKKTNYAHVAGSCFALSYMKLKWANKKRQMNWTKSTIIVKSHWDCDGKLILNVF